MLDRESIHWLLLPSFIEFEMNLVAGVHQAEIFESHIYSVDDLRSIRVPNPSETFSVTGVYGVAGLCMKSSQEGMMLIENRRAVGGRKPFLPCCMFGYPSMSKAISKLWVQVRVIRNLFVRGKHFLQQADLILYR